MWHDEAIACDLPKLRKLRGPPAIGSVIIPPGSFVASYTFIVTTSALQFGFAWEEVSV